MINEPKVGDKHWIIFVRHDGSRNREHLVIAKATILHIENDVPGEKLGPVCVCAVIPDTNQIYFAPQRVHTYHMYNTWDDAIKALEGVLTWGIQKLRWYKEEITEEARKSMPPEATAQDLKDAVEAFLSDQCSIIDIQEPFEDIKQEGNTHE